MSLFVIQNELDKVVRIWNAHQIRPRPGQGLSAVRPVLMFSLPEIHGAIEDKLKSVLPEEVAAYKEECSPKYPCDKTVFELCVFLMEEKGLTAPMDPYCHESGCHSPQLHITLGLHLPSCTAHTHSRPPLHQSHSCHHSLISLDCLPTPAPHSHTHI